MSQEIIKWFKFDSPMRGLLVVHDEPHGHDWSTGFNTVKYLHINRVGKRIVSSLTTNNFINTVACFDQLQQGQYYFFQKILVCGRKTIADYLFTIKCSKPDDWNNTVRNFISSNRWLELKRIHFKNGRLYLHLTQITKKLKREQERVTSHGVFSFTQAKENSSVSFYKNFRGNDIACSSVHGSEEDAFKTLENYKDAIYLNMVHDYSNEYKLGEAPAIESAFSKLK